MAATKHIMEIADTLVNIRANMDASQAGIDTTSNRWVIADGTPTYLYACSMARKIAVSGGAVTYLDETFANLTATGNVTVAGVVSIVTAEHVAGDFVTRNSSTGALTIRTAAEALGDLGFGAWTDYKASSTIVGWCASQPDGVIRYRVVDDLVFVQYYLDNAASNSTAVSFTLPFISKNVTYQNWYSPVYGMDNGAQLATPGLCTLGYNENVAQLAKTYADGVWTAGGRKYVSGEFFYQKA